MVQLHAPIWGVDLYGCPVEGHREQRSYLKGRFVENQRCVVSELGSFCKANESCT